VKISNVKQRHIKPVTPVGNGENIVSIEFDRADALIIVHAMQIAANTAMMCGYPDAEARFRHYQEVFTALVPKGAVHLRSEEAFTEIILAIRDKKVWRAEESSARAFQDKIDGDIIVGDRRWATKLFLTRAEYKDLLDAIISMAPMDAVFEGSTKKP